MGCLFKIHVLKCGLYKHKNHYHLPPTVNKVLINTQFVHQYQSINKGGGFVYLANGKKIKVSRKRKKLLSSAFN